MSNSLARVRLMVVLSTAGGSVQPVLAMGGGGPHVSQMTVNYCREMVVNKGITDITRFSSKKSQNAWPTP